MICFGIFSTTDELISTHLMFADYSKSRSISEAVGLSVRLVCRPVLQMFTCPMPDTFSKRTIFQLLSFGIQCPFYFFNFFSLVGAAMLILYLMLRTPIVEWFRDEHAPLINNKLGVAIDFDLYDFGTHASMQSQNRRCENLFWHRSDRQTCREKLIRWATSFGVNIYSKVRKIQQHSNRNSQKFKRAIAFCPCFHSWCNRTECNCNAEEVIFKFV